MAFDPATSAWSGWWRAPYSGAPATPTASAGNSGINGNLDEATNPATVGSLQNGYAAFDFDGVAKILSTVSVNKTDLFTNTAGSILVLVKPRSLAAASANTYQDAGLFRDQAINFGLHIADTGVKGAMFDGTSWVYSTTPQPLPVGGYGLAAMRWNGTSLEVRVGKGAWHAVPCTGIDPGAGNGLLQIGNSFGGAFLDAEVLEIATSLLALPDAELDGFGEYAEERYLLNLGFAAPWPLPAAPMMRGPIIAGPFGYFPRISFESDATLAPAVGTLAATLEDATLASAGSAPARGALTATLADASLASAGSAPALASLAATLANATLASAGSAPARGTLAATLEDATLSSVGSSLGAATGALSRTLDDAVAVAVASAPVRAALSATLQDAVLASTGSAPARASLAATLQDVTLASLATNVGGELTPEDVVTVTVSYVATPAEPAPYDPNAANERVVVNLTPLLPAPAAPASFDWEAAAARVIVN